MKKIKYLLAFLLCACICSCNKNLKKETNMDKYEKGTFGYDLNYLSAKDSAIVVLKSADGQAQVIVSPKYQAKVFTSAAEGLSGTSLGFVNYRVFESGVVDEHMNGFGGENRFWIGPEGGQFSVFFEKGKEQVYANWHTPKAIDTEAWDLDAATDQSVVLKKNMEVTNYLGASLQMSVTRVITILEPSAITTDLALANLSPEVKTVGYVTENAIVNRNDFEWNAQTGSIFIWMLDMFNTSPNAVTVVPYVEGDEKELGKTVTSDYFGEIPADRLKAENATFFLKTDGKFRSKIGLTPQRTKNIAGNYDPDSKRLTIVRFETDKNAVYLNQEWNPDKDPLVGDALNAYNDGPLEDGSIMGPFLELESVSPAAFLAPEQSLSHRHTVYHFIGDEDKLDPIVQQLLGVSIATIKNIFNQ